MIVRISGVVKKRVYLVPCTPEVKNALSQATLAENWNGFFHQLTYFKDQNLGQKNAQKSILVLSKILVFSQKNSKIAAYLVRICSELFCNQKVLAETTSELKPGSPLTCVPNLV